MTPSDSHGSQRRQWKAKGAPFPSPPSSSLRQVDDSLLSTSMIGTAREPIWISSESEDSGDESLPSIHQLIAQSKQRNMNHESRLSRVFDSCTPASHGNIHKVHSIHPRCRLFRPLTENRDYHSDGPTSSITPVQPTTAILSAHSLPDFSTTARTYQTPRSLTSGEVRGRKSGIFVPDSSTPAHTPQTVETPPSPTSVNNRFRKHRIFEESPHRSKHRRVSNRPTSSEQDAGQCIEPPRWGIRLIALDHGDWLQDIADILERADKVVVMTGAGISTGAGIPDFRSKNGLYATAGTKVRDLFDSMVLSNERLWPAFYKQCTQLRQKAKECEPTETHRFIGMLRDLDKLTRNYTQNIDLLEAKVGLSTDLKKGPGLKKNSRSDERVECVTLHGSLHELRCSLCGQRSIWEDGTLSKFQPPCPPCTKAIEARVSRGKRRTQHGYLRPDIVLYGEEHPRSEMISSIVEHDLSSSPDLLLVLGTSLKVHGFKVLVKEFAKAVHHSSGKVVLINQTDPGKQWNNVIDYWVQGDCDDWVVDLRRRKPILWSGRKVEALEGGIGKAETGGESQEGGQ